MFFVGGELIIHLKSGVTSATLTIRLGLALK